MSAKLIGHIDAMKVQPTSGPDSTEMMMSASGTHAGPDPRFDGARVIWGATTSLMNGNETNGKGTIRGMVTQVMPSDATASTDDGGVTMDRAGMTTMNGRFRTVGGTGEFASATGEGPFTVATASPIDFAGEWTGDLAIPDREAKR